MPRALTAVLCLLQLVGRLPGGAQRPARTILVPISKHFVKHIAAVPDAGTVSRPARVLLPASFGLHRPCPCGAGRLGCAGGASACPKIHSGRETLKLQHPVSDDTTAARLLTAVTAAERRLVEVFALQLRILTRPSCHVGVSGAHCSKQALGATVDGRRYPSSPGGLCVSTGPQAGPTFEDRATHPQRTIFYARERHTAPEQVRPHPYEGWEAGRNPTLRAKAGWEAGCFSGHPPSQAAVVCSVGGLRTGGARARAIDVVDMDLVAARSSRNGRPDAGCRLHVLKQEQRARGPASRSVSLLHVGSSVNLSPSFCRVVSPFPP
jgi:hypothetical protein